MTDTLDKIKKFAADAKAAKEPKEDFAAPVLADVQHGEVLCFDQTVGHTGWCRLVRVADRLEVTASGVIHTGDENSAKGPQWSLARTPDLFEAVNELLLRQPPKRIVIEMPAAFGHRTESSLIAANIIFCVARMMGWDEPAVVARQHAATLWCGSGNASKKTTGTAVDHVLTRKPQRPWNEHTRDAALLGLTYLLEARS